MLGLLYPGGPQLAALATQGEAGRFTFPRPMTDRPGLDFSFSGLKTAALTQIQNLEAEQGALSEQGSLSDQDKADIALAFEEAVVATLAIKCKRALKQTGLKRLVVAGGVSANKKLRQELASKLKPNKVYYPAAKYCTDNGAMIALAGALRLAKGEQDSQPPANLRPRWPLTELS